jgi:hypothetical protein
MRGKNFPELVEERFPAIMPRSGFGAENAGQSQEQVIKCNGGAVEKPHDPDVLMNISFTAGYKF